MSDVSEAFRLRICHRKSGRLRYLSHLEVVHACERAARRAALPYAVSQGFTPRMRIAFGPALPVGTAGEREYFDLLLTRYVPADEVLAMLTSVTAADLAPVSCGYIAAREASLAAALTIATYELDMEGGIPPEELQDSLRAAIGTGTIGIEHKGKQKVYDLTEALPKEPTVMSARGRTLVHLTVRMGEHGSLRPEALMRAVLGREVRVAATRTDLLIENEGVWRRPL